MKYFSFSILLILIISLLYPCAAYADAPSIFISPQLESYTDPSSFKVDIDLDGGGTAFNAAQAHISVANVGISNVVMGNCNFMFIITPSVDNPSFAGGIPGGSSTSCTLYTLYLEPTSTGYGSIEISDAKLISYQNTQQLIPNSQGVTGYTYVPSTVVTVTPTPTIANTISTSNTTLSSGGVSSSTPVTNGYSADFSLLGSNGTPITNGAVTLKSTTPGQNYSATSTTDSTGHATFNSLSPGVYQVTAKNGNSILADTALNIAGNNHTVSLGFQQPKSNTEQILLIAGAIIVGIIVFIFIIILIKKRRRKRPNIAIYKNQF